MKCPKSFYGEYVIPEGVEIIQRHAFKDCKELTSIVIPESVKRIESLAFSGCLELSSVTFPESVIFVGNYVFQSCKNLTTPIYNSHVIACMPDSVSGDYVIPDGIECIAGGAFQRCVDLTSVLLPDSVTSIGSDAFVGCRKLKAPIYNSIVFARMPQTYVGDYTIPSGIQKIAGGAFRFCRKLESVIMSDSVIEIGSGSFSHCTNLKNVILSCSLKSINHYAFNHCSSLFNLILPNTVTDIGHGAFRECESLVSINIPDSVNRIGGGIFTGCYSMQRPILNSTLFVYLPPSFIGEYTVPSGIQHIAGDACYECYRLTSIIFPNTLISIGSNAFWGCYKLKNINFPDSIVSVGAYAFTNCCSLMTPLYNSQIFAYLPELVSKETYAIPQEIKYIAEGAFEEANDLKSIIMPENLESLSDNTISTEKRKKIDVILPEKLFSKKGDLFDNTFTIKDVYGVKFSNYCKTLIECPKKLKGKYTIPAGIECIGYEAFKDCEDITEIVMPLTLKAIECSAFENCRNLRIINIPEELVSIDLNAFKSCDNLQQVIWSAKCCMDIYYGMFSECSNLSSFIFGENVEQIQQGLCSGLEKITSIHIPKSVKNIGEGAFEYCSHLEKITVSGENVYYDNRNDSNAIIETPTNTLVRGCENTIIPDSVVKIGNYAFSGCEKMTELRIPNNVTHIGESAFAGCSNLEYIQLPDTIERIGSYAFTGCVGITSFTMPPKISEIEDFVYFNCSNLTDLVLGDNVIHINGSAFAGCRNLISIQIPNSVVSIGSRAFAECESLTAITIPDNLSSIGFSVFAKCNHLREIAWNAKNCSSYDSAAFSMCDNIESFTFGNSVEVIPALLCNRLNKLSEIIIPSNVTSIEEKAFYGCEALTSLIIQNGVTTIGDQAFFGCTKLSSISIPESVKWIHSNAFGGCKMLTEVVLPIELKKTIIRYANLEYYYEEGVLCSGLFGGDKKRPDDDEGIILDWMTSEYQESELSHTLDEYGDLFEDDIDESTTK